jgi:glycosyltransferase involved in cell wall biosynthesis
MIGHLHTGRDWGGGEHQVAQLLRAMVRAGVPATLWARRGGLLGSRLLAEGLPVRTLSGLWRVPLGDLGLSRQLASAGVTLLHCHDSRALSLGIRLRRRLGVPLVLSRRIASPLRANPISRAKYSPRHVAAVVAVSETARDVFCRDGFPRDRVFVVPSGLDLAELDQLTPDNVFRQTLPGRYVVAGIGKLAPKKNWPLLIQAARAMQGTGLDVTWLLIGDGPERRTLETLARDLGVTERVHFLGFRADATRLLKSCDLLFFPSTREGAPGTVRQAMALGIPVVAADAAGTVESLGGHGWIVGADDVAGAVRAVTEALTDTARREAVTRAARVSARERFAFERTLGGTLEVYASLMGSPDREAQSSLRA